ncbi:Leucine--tRNA ligase [Flavobacterium longum]|uniref:leucine--tRNA ligase n=1 Tax=Flavobacterium longum TaxID=1299340 RepID=UPI0039EB1028
MKYNPQDIEAKWQKYWAENQTFAADNHSDKPKYYVLDMFPYPSGAGLHVGHPLGYIASDIYARFKRHKGFNVLHPMGYDSFGLPAEQYAIQTGQHPEKTTRENIGRYREQLDKIGFSFDWQREVRTSNPDYYKWTQWIFIQLFNSWYNKTTDKAESICTLIMKFEENGSAGVKAVCDDNATTFTAAEWNVMSKAEQEKILLQYRLTYLAETEVNWCPALGTVLANDEIVNGVSERGGYPVVRKKMTQWSMRISAYAERLLQGLDSIDWTDSLKESQRNWIGKSVGALVKFQVTGYLGDTIADPEDPIIEVFTTRPDTIFGVSFLTLAPEHPLVQQITTDEQRDAVNAYIDATAKRSERDRMADVKTISGVFTGAYAAHPLSGLPVPIWIGDYVLAGYGTGAVMAVPAGDQRDYDFAKHFHLPIENIFDGIDISEKANDSKDNVKLKNSDFLNGLDYKSATKKVIEALEEVKMGTGKTNYRLRDAVFSRQRYWGEPFPVYYKDGMPQMIDVQHLPIRLPEVEKYLPTEDGAPPLGNAPVWAWDTVNNEVVSNDKIDNLDVFPLELNTMPGWAGSSWYWLRYMDAQNEDKFVSPEAEQYWQNVDLYIGGSEHATGHLLYSRFWNKFLYDRGLVHFEEPFKKLINQGMILGTSAIAYRISGTNQYVSKNLKKDYQVEDIRVDVNLVNASDEVDIDKLRDWIPEFKNAEFILENGRYFVGREVEKMSKRWYNVVNPDDICNEYGADTLRLYEMFLGPLEQYKPWNTAGITGVFGFLKKLWRLYFDDNGLIVTSNPASKDALKSLHKTIKKVQEDIEGFSFNTSVSQFMICVNELSAMNCHERAVLEPLAVIISPYAPHIAEELWHRLGHEGSVSNIPFPKFNPEFLVESSKEYPVSLNGKTKFFIELPLDLTKEQIEEIILKDDRTTQMLDGNAPKKVIVVPGKIINLVP